MSHAPAPSKHRETLERTVTALNGSGAGVVRVGDKSVQLVGALPGERVALTIEHGAKGALRVVAFEALTQSDARVEPQCPVYGTCGGCTMQHASPTLQAQVHREGLVRALPAALRDVPVHLHAADAPYGYRIRARLAWQRGRGDAVALGFRARVSTDVVDTPTCPVLDRSLDAAREALRPLLRALSARGEVSIALGAARRPVASLRPEELAGRAAFAALEALFATGRFAGLALHPPGGAAAYVLGDPRPQVEGADGEPLRLAMEGFSQANERLNTALARFVVAQASARGRAVLELFAGAGNFTVLLAREARAVTAVELDRDATTALRANLAARAIENVRVVEGDATGALPGGRFESVVLDPPRAGARDACEALAANGTAKGIVYVSCDPATLGRDLALLQTQYALERLDAFEMFPQTGHVETVATLARRVRPRGR